MNLRTVRSSAVALLLAAVPLSSQSPSFAPPCERGPLGGAAIGIAIDPANPGEVLVIKYTLGLYRSLDAGTTFEPVSGLPSSTHSLTQDPKDPRRLFALDDTRIYESTDFGATWSLLTLVGANRIEGVAVPAAGNDLLAFDAWNVYHSDDDGATWTVADAVVPFSGDIYDAVAYAPSDPSVAYVGTLRRGVLKSTDGGASWFDAGPATAWSKALAVSPTDPDFVLSGSLGGDVYRSTDGGLTFQQATSGLTSSSSVVFFAWEPGGSRLWMGMLDGLFTTADLGLTWVDANGGFPSTRPIGQALGFPGNGDVCLAAESGSLGGGGGGLYLLTPGSSTWDHMGFLEVQIKDAMIAQPGGERVVGVLDGVYAGPHGDDLQPTAWQFGVGAATHALAVDPTDPTRWLAAGVGAFVDNAQVMVLTGNGTGYAKSYERWGAGTVQDVVFDPFDANRVLAGIFPSLFGNEALILSDDGGNSFVDVPGTSGWATRAIAFDPHHPGRVLQLSNNNQWSGSVDGGQTWIGRQPAWPATGRAVLLAYDPFVPFRLYRGDAGSGLWRSDDNGATWVSLGVGLHDESDLVLHPQMPGLLWVSDDAGQVLVSGDFGDTFINAMEVPQGSVATAMSLDTADGSLLVGTLEASAWELEQASPMVKLGSGTAGRGGFVPRHYTAGGLPQLGNGALQLVGDGIRGGAPVFLAISLNEASLPAFGGTVYFTNPVSAPQLVASGNGAGGEGSFTYPVPIPATPSLAGVEIVTQFAAIDDDAVSHRRIVLSDGLRTRLLP